MTRITIYDVDAEVLEEIAEANDTSVAEVVYMLTEYIEEMKTNNNLN